MRQPSPLQRTQPQGASGVGPALPGLSTLQSGAAPQTSLLLRQQAQQLQSMLQQQQTLIAGASATQPLQPPPSAWLAAWQQQQLLMAELSDLPADTRRVEPAAAGGCVGGAGAAVSEPLPLSGMRFSGCSDGLSGPSAPAQRPAGRPQQGVHGAALAGVGDMGHEQSAQAGNQWPGLSALPA